MSTKRNFTRLEVGKSYRRRDGQVVTIDRYKPRHRLKGDTFYGYDWYCNDFHSYNAQGDFHTSPYAEDLITLIEDAPVIKFEVGKSYKTRGGWKATVDQDDKDGSPLRVTHYKPCMPVDYFYHEYNGKFCNPSNEEVQYDLISPWIDAPAKRWTLEARKHYMMRDGRIGIAEATNRQLSPFNINGNFYDTDGTRVYAPFRDAKEVKFPAIEDWGTEYNATNLIDATKQVDEPVVPKTEFTIDGHVFKVGKFYRGNDPQNNNTWVHECINVQDEAHFRLLYTKSRTSKWIKQSPYDYEYAYIGHKPRQEVIVEHNQTIVYDAPKE